MDEPESNGTGIGIIMADSKSTSSGGIGLGGVLLCIFVTLKLCKVIDWSWWWVLNPLWIGAAIWLVFLAVVGLVIFLKR